MFVLKGRQALTGYPLADSRESLARCKDSGTLLESAAAVRGSSQAGDQRQPFQAPKEPRCEPVAGSRRARPAIGRRGGPESGKGEFSRPLVQTEPEPMRLERNHFVPEQILDLRQFIRIGGEYMVQAFVRGMQREIVPIGEIENRDRLANTRRHVPQPKTGVPRIFTLPQPQFPIFPLRVRVTDIAEVVHEDAMFLFSEDGEERCRERIRRLQIHAHPRR